MDNKHENLAETLKRDIAFTSGNYGQMYNRFLRRDWASRLLIVYYSIVTIVYTLCSVCFPNYFTNSNLLNFCSICVSIVALVASLMVSFAKYAERSLEAMKALDSIKRLKKELAKYSDADLFNNKYEIYDDFVKRYHEIVDRVELRADVDYFRTCKSYKNHENYSDSWKRLNRFQQVIAHTACLIEYGIYVALAIAPIITLLRCISVT